MNYRIKSTLLAAVFLVGFVQSNAQEPALKISLEQAVELAMTHHQGLKNARLDVDQARHQVKEVTSMGLPQVSASGIFSHTYEIPTQLMPGEFAGMPGQFIPVQFGVPYNLSGTVSMNQLIFDGTFFLGLKAASEFVRVQELLTSKSEIEVKEGVLKAYYMALITEQNIQQLESTLKNVQSLKAETEEMYKSGYAEKLDVDRMVLSESNLSISLNQLKEQLELAKGLLLNSMGLKVNQSIELTSELPTIEAPNASDIGANFDVNQRIEYKILEQQQTLNHLNLKRFKVGYIPSLYGMVNYGSNAFATDGNFDQLGNDWYPNGMYAFSLSVPIFDGFYKKAKIDQAKVDIAKTLNTMEQVENGIQLEVQQAQNRFTHASNNLNLQQKNKDLAEEIYRTTSIKFKEGIGSSFEMIQAENELTEAKTNYLNAVYELSVAKIQLDKALGRL